MDYRRNRVLGWLTACLVFSTLGLGGAKCSEDPRSRFPEAPGLVEYQERVAQLRDRVPGVEAACSTHLSERLGVQWAPDAHGDLPGLKVSVVEYVQGCGQMSSDAACTGGNGNHVDTQLLAPVFTSGAGNLDLTLCHEMVHALFRRLLSTSSYSRLPRWFREGSAVYLAGQGEAKLVEHVLSHLQDPTALLQSGLLEAFHQDKYFFYELAFECLDQDSPGRADRVLKRVLGGESVEGAVKAETSLDLTAFSLKVGEYAGSRIWALLNQEPRLMQAESLAQVSATAAQAEGLWVE
ncbi:MAG TPA: hypothetical protein VL588_00015, partial [Bdellovibrionota bacterium]|nr:hypothetical protein [Bdellovibrionota bacterium]